MKLEQNVEVKNLSTICQDIGEALLYSTNLELHYPNGDVQTMAMNHATKKPLEVAQTLKEIK